VFDLIYRKRAQSLDVGYHNQPLLLWYRVVHRSAATASGRAYSAPHLIPF
jgi:hypothetical protein